MEISKHQIARLVLGYLKSEKCKKAFDEFLVKSQYLKSSAVFVKNGKYFATRVGGLTLEDILAEYSDIALIIQGRLEETDYYEKNHKMRLSEQLTYIFDHCSRSVSPVLSNDLNATPIESLPGNSSNITQKLQGRTDVNSENTTTIGYDDSSDNSEVSSQKDEKKTLAELDHKITSLKQKAEKDPAFDKLLEEIIGHKNETPIDCTTTRNNSEKNQSNVFIQNCQAPETSMSKLTVDVSDDYKKQTGLLQGAIATKTSDAQFSHHQSQIFMTSTPSLLMVPSLVGPSNYILVNSGPVGNAAPLSTVLTETDIMKMPTVILEGGSSSTQQQMVTVPQHQAGNQPLQMPPDRRSVPMTESQIIITSHPQTTTSSLQKSPNCKPVVKKVRTLVPKTDKVTIASSDGDFYRVCNDNLEIPEADDTENIRTRGGLRKRMARMAQLRSEAPPSPKLEKKSPPKTEKVQSPPKKAAECNDRKKGRVNKSLFAEGRKLPKDTWDADLRELLIPKPNVTEEKMDISDQNLDTTCEEEIDDEELKKEAKMLEDAFKTPVKPERKPEPNQISPPVEEKTEVIEKPEEKQEEASVPKEEPTKTEEQEPEEETRVLTVETEVYLRNCNGPPRIKKKCNQTESNEVVEVEIFQETSSFEDVKQTKVLTLETPMKAQFPKTPGKFENMTPFSKVLEEQLQGMDLLSLPTPTTIIQTPVFPITPNVALNTPEHANRPTDYSTSSSYYQPSDTEQNKSLETLMEQYKKEEGVERKPGEEETAKGEIKAMFNKNVIGKKNLSLMKKEEDSSDSESDSSSSDDDDDSGSDSEAETKKGRKRKAPTPKDKENRPFPKEEKIEMENEITDDDFALHLSTDEDSFNKITNKPTKTDEASAAVDETTEEAKQLIQGLYERGIHLLPKVSADKPSSASSVLEKRPDPNALENLDVSSEEELNLSKNPEEIAFDCKHFEPEDVIRCSYDYGKRKKKKSYDLAVLERKLEANVYIEALNTNMIRWITFGPTTQILDYSPKKVAVRRRSVKGTPKPKEMNKIKIKLKTETSNKASKDSKEPENSQNKSKRLRSSSTDIKSKENTANKKSNVVPLSKAEIARNKMVEKLMQDEKKTITESKEDDLMDFAVLGASSEQKKEEGVTSREKRKLNSEVDVLPPEKKAKTETEKRALLKGINVDVFLNTVHGVSKPS